MKNLTIDSLEENGFAEKRKPSNPFEKRKEYEDDYFIVTIDLLDASPERFRFIGYGKTSLANPQTYLLRTIDDLKKYYKMTTGRNLS